MKKLLADTITIKKRKAKTEEKTKTSEEAQVVVHCYLRDTRVDKIRLWPSTFLFDVHSSHKSKLMHAEGITMYPHWKDIPTGTQYSFTLWFSPLPKSCTQFDLKEVIPEWGAFEVNGIPRNKSDVYRVWIE